MKKGVSFIWDQACQEAYKDIKRYLTKPPVLVALTSRKPFLRKPFLIYVKAIDHSLGALLAQKDDKWSRIGHLLSEQDSDRDGISV